MKHLTTSFFLLLASFSAFTQGNVIKVNVTSLVFKDIYVSYERTILKKFSVNLGFDIMPERNLPFASFFPDVNGKPSPANDMRISGWRITPEFRFYTSRIKGSPRGFYLAPYLRYAHFNFALDGYQYEYTDVYDGNKPKTARMDFDGNISSIGGGLMIGHQWIISKHLSLDLWIVGLGIGGNKFSLKASSKELDPRYFQEGSNFTNDIEDALRFFTNVNVTTGQDFAEVDSKSINVGLRGLGFNVGFAF